MTPSACGSGACPRPRTGSVPPSSPRRETDMLDDQKIRCDACPVMCYIAPGATGACDRYANHDGTLVRVDPHVLLERRVHEGGTVVPFSSEGQEWDGEIIARSESFVTA